MDYKELLSGNTKINDGWNAHLLRESVSFPDFTKALAHWSLQYGYVEEQNPDLLRVEEVTDDIFKLLGKSNADLYNLGYATSIKLGSGITHSAPSHRLSKLTIQKTAQQLEQKNEVRKLFVAMKYIAGSRKRLSTLVHTVIGGNILLYTGFGLNSLFKLMPEGNPEATLISIAAFFTATAVTATSSTFATEMICRDEAAADLKRHLVEAVSPHLHKNWISRAQEEGFRISSVDILNGSKSSMSGIAYTPLTRKAIGHLIEMATDASSRGPNSNKGQGFVVRVYPAEPALQLNYMDIYVRYAPKANKPTKPKDRDEKISPPRGDLVPGAI